jgi:hypothetical protein
MVEWSIGGHPGRKFNKDSKEKTASKSDKKINVKSSIFSNGHHLLWRAGLSNIILKEKCIKLIQNTSYTNGSFSYCIVGKDIS